MTQSTQEIQETIDAIGNLVHLKTQETALQHARDREQMVRQFRASLGDENKFRQHPDLAIEYLEPFESLFLVQVSKDQRDQVREQARLAATDRLSDDACPVLQIDVYLRELEIACLELVSSNWPVALQLSDWGELIRGLRAELTELLDRAGR